MALMDITVIPLDDSRGSFGGFIASLQELLEGSGCSYSLHDMGTTVEGPVRRLFEIAEMLHEHSFSLGGTRVYTVLKIDDRRDRDVHIGDKIASVKAKIVPSSGGGK
jgi:uncharacterized protein (TIGR00106 family)